MAKYLLALSVLCIFGIAASLEKQETEDDLMSKMETCKTEAGATDADLKAIVAQNSSSTAEGKCLRSCLMKKYEMMTVNGTFVPDIALKYAERYADGDAEKLKKAKEIVKSCARIKVSPDHCQAAEQYSKCLIKKAADRGLTQFKL
ncbi:general odorant-binding protein 28a-like [Musca domestica]|uniref:General odorant-binding protein 28a-like n=1 Tax=Musca domestica TaxID=7370 RepID=A0ABM3VD61_MUSDO|nr:general odorant-binding protein 28a-like [Musca domestica]